MMIEVRVPGAVFYECFDPACTEFPRENPQIEKPTWVRMGKGGQFRYLVEPADAQVMIDHAWVWGTAMSFGVDDSRPGRMVARWVEREAERLGIEINRW